MSTVLFLLKKILIKGFDMPKVPTPLTDTKIKKLKAKEKVYRESDGNNLYIEIKPNGSKLWRFRYKQDGKYNMMSLGKYPDISLKEARDQASKYKKILATGGDIRQSKKKGKLFFELVEEFMEFKEKSLSEKYFKNQWGKIKNYLYPTLQHKAITEITKSDILSILKKIPEIKIKNDTKNKNKAETVRKVYILIKEILRYALHNDYIEKNVAEAIDLKQVIPKQEVEHFKAELDISELRKIYKLIEEYPSYTTRLALKFMMLTAVRVGNVRNLKWEWIDTKRKMIIYPASAMKTREEFRLPLTDTLIMITEKMKEATTDREFVFCSPIAPSKQMSENTLNFALKRMDLDVTAHGFRSSFSTLCYENQRVHGFSMEVIETQLSHKIGNSITRAYMRSDFLEERRELLRWWEGFLK